MAKLLMLKKKKKKKKKERKEKARFWSIASDRISVTF